MKKFLFTLLVLASFAFANKAQAQQTRTSYYYYPQSNVYYNPHTHEYAYDDNGSWGYRRTLPSGVKVQRGSYVTVYGNGPEIWNDNTTHREKYKNWKGKQKAKKKAAKRYDRNHDRN